MQSCVPARTKPPIRSAHSDFTGCYLLNQAWIHEPISELSRTSCMSFTVAACTQVSPSSNRRPGPTCESPGCQPSPVDPPNISRFEGLNIFTSNFLIFPPIPPRENLWSTSRLITPESAHSLWFPTFKPTEYHILRHS